MKSLFLLLIALTAVPSFAKIQTYYSNQAVLAHVLKSSQLAKLIKQSKELSGTELVRTEIDRKGKELQAKYAVKLQYVNVDGGLLTNCTTRASVRIEIYTFTPPGTPRPITASRLTAPRFSALACAE